jgi:hypothetical protein
VLCKAPPRAIYFPSTNAASIVLKDQCYESKPQRRALFQKSILFNKWMVCF